MTDKQILDWMEQKGRTQPMWELTIESCGGKCRIKGFGTPLPWIQPYMPTLRQAVMDAVMRERVDSGGQVMTALNATFNVASTFLSTVVILALIWAVSSTVVDVMGAMWRMVNRRIRSKYR